MKRHTYVLGAGLSHNGSACLLKDGKICVAIEKERITRFKHDGGNDSVAVDYCLKAEGINFNDLDLIVQNANFGMFKFGNDYFRGDRAFAKRAANVPVITISHHLAHAYSTVGTCPFDTFNVVIMDGCGNSYDDCCDLEDAYIFDKVVMQRFSHLFNEKDSYYHFDNSHLTTIVKDFSEWGMENKEYLMHPPSTKHSIGGVYAAASMYCFGNMNDAGKLMGLGPYGRHGIFKDEIFLLRDGRVFVNYDWMGKFTRPARSYDDFKKNFQYYADVASWVQREVEKAILYVFQSRLQHAYADNVCYAGGTALNAVANTKLLSSHTVKNLYIEPAAGDNGLAVGCAFYGWIEVLKRDRVLHNGSTCFGYEYTPDEMQETIRTYIKPQSPVKVKRTIDRFFSSLDTTALQQPADPMTIQFNIENIGVYQLRINHRIACENQILEEPSTILRINGNMLYVALMSNDCWIDVQRSLGIAPGEARQLDTLTKSVDLNGAIKAVKDEISIESKERVSYHRSEDVVRETAALLSEGRIIAWFQGGCEFGPRALGRRSIIADPRQVGLRDFVNLKIKLREDFRPFAPSVLQEDAVRYFENGFVSPYMILVDRVRKEWRDKIGSVVHEDDSSRVQTVTPDWNSRYYALLNAFKKLTGISVLLNTSMNRKGMPIIETPKDALDFFFSSEIDQLIMGEFIITK